MDDIALCRRSLLRSAWDRMVEQKKISYHTAAYLLMLLAFAAFFLSVFFCLRAQSAPSAAEKKPEADIHTEVFEEFFSCLARGDFAGADRHLTGGGLGFAAEPEEKFAATLWRAQQDAWSFERVGDLTLQGKYLIGKYRIHSLDLAPLSEIVRDHVNALLEEAAGKAAAPGEIYAEDGSYRQELLDESLDDAFLAVMSDTGPFAFSREIEIRTEFVDGQWRIIPEAELLQTLTGGIVQDSGGGDNAQAYCDYANNVLARAMDGLAAIPVVYRLPENTVVAPKPNKTAFGRSKKAADTAAVLKEASALTSGHELIWTPETKTVDDKWINWYRDDTILAISWRQRYGGMYFTFCEVVVAHPSQFRRYLADDAFNSRYRYTPTQMAKTVNAVVGFSGDFYKYRKLGIVVYHRELFRADPKSLDTCFVDTAGNLHFVHKGTLADETAIREYIRDNDIVFSLAFGPIMIENGEICVPTKKYPIGQIHDNYSRCAISQLGEGHYLLATTSRSANGGTLQQMAEALKSLGVENAYALDGGQTASIVINGKLVNPVDFGEERMMSDIIYFASAIPDGE